MPSAPANDYLTELVVSVESDGSDYTLLSNGSLVIVDTGTTFSSTTPGATSPVGSLAFEFNSDETVYFGGGDTTISYTDGGNPVACTIATNSDGTCPLTCSVNGYTAPYENDNGALGFQSEELVDIEGFPVVLYAIGTAPATS